MNTKAVEKILQKNVYSVLQKNYIRLVIRYFSYYISSNKIKLVAISLVKILFIEKAEL